jgi:hypothetical protein
MSHPTPPGVWPPGRLDVTEWCLEFNELFVPVGTVALWTLGVGRSLIWFQQTPCVASVGFLYAFSAPKFIVYSDDATRTVFWMSFKRWY